MASEQANKRRRLWHNILLLSVFGLYVAIFLLLLFGKPNFWKSVNLTPFYSIRAYLSHSMPMALSNLAGNILLFVPLGVYLPLFSKGRRPWLSLLWIFLISTAVEAAQYFFRIGSADIDDVILNVTGGLMGILLFKLMGRIFKERSRDAIELVALAVGIVFVVAALCLHTGVLGIRMRIF